VPALRASAVTEPVPGRRRSYPRILGRAAPEENSVKRSKWQDEQRRGGGDIAVLQRELPVISFTISTGRLVPPSAATTAKTSKARMTRRMIAVCRLGRSNGSVMRAKRCHGLAQTLPPPRNIPWG